MTHPLVTQLRFARSEFVRCLHNTPVEDTTVRIQPMNCLSWIVGHLANQEHFLWVQVAQGREVAPGLNKIVGYGKPASTPPWADMWSDWHSVTRAADDFLDTIRPESIDQYPTFREKSLNESIGTLLLRNIYHYWFHTGEAHAIRQSLGHPDLPQFVGDMEDVLYT